MENNKMNMIDNTTLSRLVILLLIDKRPVYRSSYVLIKVLSRIFGILDFREPVDFLVENGLIERNFINQIGHFNLTPMGEDLLHKHEGELHSRLIELYSNEKEFIDNLWSKE